MVRDLRRGRCGRACHDAVRRAYRLVLGHGLRRKVESAVSSPWQLYEFERRICPECTRSRGRGTRPHFRRIDGFRAREHCKDQIAVSASDLGEPGLAHPRELLADGCGQVMFHPLNRGIEVTLADLQLACALDPHLARALIDSRGVSPPTW